jgi:hypothetical protein
MTVGSEPFFETSSVPHRAVRGNSVRVEITFDNEGLVGSARTDRFVSEAVTPCRVPRRRSNTSTHPLWVS